VVITEAFVALRAFAAIAMFTTEPSGRLMGVTDATLARSPFAIRRAGRYEHERACVDSGPNE
jgi:hypothetical protein